MDSIPSYRLFPLIILKIKSDAGFTCLLLRRWPAAASDPFL